MKRDNHIVRTNGVDYRLCTRCNRLKKLRTGFDVRKSKSGRILYSDICKRCKANKNLERYHRNKQRQEIQMPNRDRDNVQACEVCKFLNDCNYRVKVVKSIDSPYCFVDSRYHFIFVREYGKVR